VIINKISRNPKEDC